MVKNPYYCKWTTYNDILPSYYIIDTSNPNIPIYIIILLILIITILIDSFLILNTILNYN